MKSKILIMLSLLLSINILSVAATSTSVIKISLTDSNVVLNEGQSKSETAKLSYVGNRKDISIVYSSDNPKVATFNNGVIKAISAGTTIVRAKAGNKQVTCKVTVKAVAPVVLNTTQAYTYLNNYRKQDKSLLTEAKKKYNSELAKAKKIKNKTKRNNAIKAAKTRYKNKSSITLVRDKNLEKLALIRCKEIATSGKFSHTRPNGKSSLTIISGNKHKGENIAKGFNDCKSVSIAFYKSASHRANMLRKPFTKVGIAAYKYKGVTYWCQLYSS